jgi:hypothetical protein
MKCRDIIGGQLGDQALFNFAQHFLLFLIVAALGHHFQRKL